MKVDRISYQKIFPTGMMYLNHKIGVEIQVEENDDCDEVFKGAKAMVEQWNFESNPSYAATLEYMKSPEVKETNIEKERLSIAIENCTTLPQLKIHENDSMKYDLVQEYINKKKQLQ